MPPAKKKTSADNLGTWRISIIRDRAQFLGFVEAPDRQAAGAAAASWDQRVPALISLLSLSTISPGVFLGAPTPYQLIA